LNIRSLSQECIHRWRRVCIVEFPLNYFHEIFFLNFELNFKWATWNVNWSANSDICDLGTATNI
jgi:hypothetical protein